MSMPSLEPEETPLAPDELARQRPRSTAASARGTRQPARQTPAATRSRSRGPVLEPAADGWALIALVPYDGHEPPATVSDELAQGGLVRRLGALASVAPGARRRASPDRVGRFAVAARLARDPGDRQRGRRPASFRLPDAGRGRQDGAARVGHRPRGLDPPDSDPAGSRRGPGDGRKRRA